MSILIHHYHDITIEIKITSTLLHYFDNNQWHINEIHFSIAILFTAIDTKKLIK
jgi:hypothetical protein